jgi:hypothetical protein
MNLPGKLSGNHIKTFSEPQCNLKMYVLVKGNIFTSVLRMLKKSSVLPVRKRMASFPKPMANQKLPTNQMC